MSAPDGLLSSSCDDSLAGSLRVRSLGCSLAPQDRDKVSGSRKTSLIPVSSGNSCLKPYSPKPSRTIRGGLILAQIMTTKELAVYLRLHQITICKLSKEGKIPSIRIGRVWRFDKEVIDDWIAKKWP